MTFERRQTCCAYNLLYKKSVAGPLEKTPDVWNKDSGFQTTEIYVW